MKQIIFSCIILLGLLSKVKAGELNQVILKAFKETYPEAQNVIWSASKNNTQASFSLNQISIIADYDDNGNLLKTRRFYSQQYLIPVVLMKIKNQYGNKEIEGITEVCSGGDIIYEITLKDYKHWYKIISDAYGNLELHEKFVRAEPNKN